LSAHIQLQATADYYDEIEELVEFKKRYADQCVCIAQILERYMGTDEQYVLIDKGSRDGLHDRMVLVYKDMLVGRVHQVFPLYSKCLLITDERCKIGAYCASTKAEGVTKGCNNDDLMTLEYVSHLSAMQEHDLIISSGQGLIFPRGFGIARVVDFSKEDLLYRVSCRALIDIYRLRHCYVLQKS
jgi:rod shape-determining protein MreC